MILSIIAFIIVLGVLVFVHELGHFSVAKWCGMRVDEFSIGFPPRLIYKKKGDTLYSINLIPLGGYVRIHGENGHDDDAADPRSFQNKSVWQRIAVIVAGVVMNMLFAFVVLTVAFSVGFISTGQTLEAIPGAVVTHAEVVVVQVQPGSPAEGMGIKAGDLIKKIKDETTGVETAIYTPEGLKNYTVGLQQLGHLAVTVDYDEDGTAIQKAVSLSPTGAGLGIAIDAYNTVRVPVLKAPKVAIQEIGYISKATWHALSDFGIKLFGHAQLDPSVSGPIGIYQASASAAHQGILSVIFLMVALSINLALLNILPIPPLDGGRLLFLLIELVFRRKVVHHRIENAIAGVGMILLLGLIAVISVKDIIKLL